MEQFETYFELRRIVLRLTKYQRTLVRAYIPTFASNHSANKDNKTLSYFNLLVKALAKEKSLPPLKAQILAKAQSQSAFNRANSRLIKKIGEALNLSFNCASEAYSQYAQVRLNARLKLNEASMFESLGGSNTALQLLQAVIAQAEQHEQYDLLVTSLQELYWRLISGHNKNKGESLKNRLELARKKRKWLEFAKDSYYQYKGQVQYTAIGKVGLPFFYQTMNELTTIFSAANSHHIAYYYLQLLVEFYQSVDEVAIAHQKAILLVDIVSAKPQVLSNAIIGISLATLADSEARLGMFDTALIHLNEALLLFKAEINIVQTLEQVGFLEIYQNNPETALEKIEEMLERLSATPSLFLSERGEYLKACALYVAGNRHKAKRMISQQRGNLEEDKPGWNLGRRLFELMLAFESENYRGLEAKIESCSKFVQRNKSRAAFRERDLAFLHLFSSTNTHGFAPEQFLALADANIGEFCTGEPEMRWEPSTHEVVHYGCWLRSITLQEPYTFSLSEDYLAAVRDKVGQEVFASSS